MQIDDQLLNHLEKLAMLEIAPEKRSQIKEQLSEILSFVEKLNELDTTKFEAAADMADKPTYLRPDEPHIQEEVTKVVFKHAPKIKENYFVVPRVVS